MPKRLILLLAVAASVAGGTVRADVEVIPLKYRNAEQVLPILRPLVEPGGALTGMQNQLILRASRRNIDEIRSVLSSIDTQPRRLMISVRQDGDESTQRAGIDAGVSAGGGRVVIGSAPPGRDGVSARITDSRGSSQQRVSQQVQVLEGYPAMINIGQSVPVPSRSVTQTINGVVVTDTVGYRDIGTGFEVVPRLSGDRVQLDISPRRETPGAFGQGSVNTQRIVTTASGRLGEWFELGGLSEDSARQGSGILSSSSAERRDNRRVLVKVDLLP